MTPELIPVEQKLSDEEQLRLRLFKARFDELWSNWLSLKSAGIKLSGSFGNNGGGKVVGGGCAIEAHRLKGFFLDFRPFWQDGEPTHIKRTTGLLGRVSGDPRLHKLLRENREAWAEAEVMSGVHGYSTDRLTDLLFNGRYFHSDERKVDDVARLKELMSDEVLLHLLMLAMHHRMLVVRNIAWIIEPLVSTNGGEQRLRIPTYPIISA